LTVETHYSVVSPCGKPHFVKPATNKKSPKIYVVSREGKILYVGSTRQPMASRFSGAFAADGKGGYYGYPWKKAGGQMNLDIWIFSFPTNMGEAASTRELETIEAEVVFCVRRHSDHWPLAQTEIHFHESEASHREVAEKIYHCGLKK
jgi:hypothetical protein